MMQAKTHRTKITLCPSSWTSCTVPSIAKVTSFHPMTCTISTRFVAFTAQHIRSLTDLAEVHSLPLPDGDVSHLSESSDFLSASGSSAPRTLASDDNPTLISSRLSEKSQYTPEKSLDDLAKEFGVDAQVVRALAERLAKVP